MKKVLKQKVTIDSKKQNKLTNLTKNKKNQKNILRNHKSPKKPQNKTEQVVQPNFNDIPSYARFLENWLLANVSTSKANGVVFGLSGGIDSAVVAALAKQVFGHNHLAVVMHMNNSQLDEECTTKAIDVLQLNAVHLNLLPAAIEMAYALNIDPKLQPEIFGNIKARIRTIALYSLAQKNNYLVCGTSNYDEWMTGYFTKYGDSACDLAPLRNLLKSDVYALGRHYLVPQNIMRRAPSASLVVNQTDENDLNLKYIDLDQHFLNTKPLKGNDLKHFNDLHERSNHKRNLPPAPMGIFKLK
ncbi:NAD(+) synthase [[Mycoplasma] testudinis]|uniref:NAD(+) synthase n=1 Tax=[Mycoplasma] testudinis TaxID=33924 RepID=UPI000696FD8B|nr:NAD(+) synthase [[Mycoplasma] testudinis]